MCEITDSIYLNPDDWELREERVLNRKSGIEINPGFLLSFLWRPYSHTFGPFRSWRIWRATQWLKRRKNEESLFPKEKPKEEKPMRCAADAKKPSPVPDGNLIRLLHLLLLMPAEPCGSASGQ